MVKTENLKPRKFKSGFTLLELLVVVGILAALVALALPFYQDYVNQSKLTAAEADLQTFKKAIAMFDQLEPKPFGAETAHNMRSLIGKYIQDYRTYANQNNPIDPWGNDYAVIASEGTILSMGPDGYRQTALSARVPSGDDILVTWKAPFFLASARAVNQNTIEVIFSRKIKDVSGKVATTLFSATPATAAPLAASTVQRISDTIYRFTTTGAMNSGIGSVNVTAIIGSNLIEAMDGKSVAFDNNPETGATGATYTFTY